MKTCFVVQGFGKKTDFRTGRVLDLDASYEVIKEAVEAAGFECIRADEIEHSGLIDKPMYEHILHADLVIADLSTSNVNAVYELGVRHALRPRATIIIAESQFDFAFDINRNLIRTYEHLGPDLGRREAKQFTETLTRAIDAIFADADAIDSPLYTFIPQLDPPSMDDEQAEPEFALRTLSRMPEEPRSAFAFGETGAPSEQSTRQLIEQARQAIAGGDHNAARDLLEKAHALKPNDASIVQLMAWVMYDASMEHEETLSEARQMLESLKPKASLDPETLKLWGDVHIRYWDLHHQPEYLNDAIFAYGKSFNLRNDYLDGITLAFLLNVRAAHAEPAEAIADFIMAQRIRRQVTEMGVRALEALRQAEQEAPPETPEETNKLKEKKYEILAALWEAAVGLGDEATTPWKQQAFETAPSFEKLEATQQHLAQLNDLLADAPLKYLAAP